MWTGIKRWFRNVFCTEWQHVGLFEVVTRYKHSGWTTYIHCYESQHGDREIEIIGAMAMTSEAQVYDKSDFESLIKISELYQKELYPWLKGRAHDKIPHYELVKSQKFDFTKKLKGETPIVLNDDDKA